MVTLRPYQQRALDGLRAHHRERPILMLPTGAGKTVVASALIQSACAKGKRVLFLVHRRELVAQAVARLEDWGVTAGVIAAGWKPSDSQVQVASIQTLVRRKRPPADVVIVDECQHARSETWQELLDHYAPPAGCCECKQGQTTEHDGPCQLWPAACIVGLSATPYRLDGRGLGRVFGAIVRPVTVRELVTEGVLVAPRILAPPPPDLDGVRITKGDYDPVELERRMRNLTGDVVAHWQKHAAGKKTVAFACSIAHSEKLVERFQEAGVRAAHLDGAANAPERDAVLARLRAGELDVVSNCMVLGEGWDLPALQCAVLARPTASQALHRQQIGRIMRAAPGKDGALVLDHAGNTLRLGLVTSEVEVDLDDRKRAAVTLEPIKTCPECFCVVPANSQVCPECGHVFETEKRDRTVEDDRDLIEIPQDSPAEMYRWLVGQSNAWSRRLGWARHQYRERFGDWPNAGAQLGRKVTDEIEDGYRCIGWEGRAGQWGEFCGRCFKKLRDHDQNLAETRR